MIPLDWLEEESHSLQHKEPLSGQRRSSDAAPHAPYRIFASFNRNLPLKQSCVGYNLLRLLWCYFLRFSGRIKEVILQPVSTLMQSYLGERVSVFQHLFRPEFISCFSVGGLTIHTEATKTPSRPLTTSQTLRVLIYVSCLCTFMHIYVLTVT